MKKTILKNREKALIFIGFRHKKDSIMTAREEGFKTILLTRKILNEAQGLFDETFELDLHNVKEVEEIIPGIKAKYKVKGIISNYEHYVVTRSFLAEHFRIPSSSVYSAATTRNKLLQRHALDFMEENISYRAVRTEKQALNALQKFNNDIFLKSIAGVKSRLVFHVNSEEKLKKAFEKLSDSTAQLDEDLYNDYEYCDFNFQYPNPKKVFLAEKAIPGEQVTVASLVSNHTIWHAPSVCDIYPASHIGRDDSFLAFRILPSKLSPDLQKKCKQTTETAAKILGLRYCPLHCEVIITKDKEVKLIEIASRMGGYRPQMYKEAYGFNLNKLLVQSVIGNQIRSNKKPKQFVSMMEIFPEKAGKFKSIKNLALIKNDPETKQIEVIAKTGEAVGPAKDNFKPCLRFLLIGNSYEDVYEKSMIYQKKLEVVLK